MIYKLLILFSIVSLVVSAPTVFDDSKTIVGESSGVGAGPSTRPSNSCNQRDYVNANKFQSTIEVLGTESHIINQKANYVSDDVPLEEILKIIELSEVANSATVQSTSQIAPPNATTLSSVRSKQEDLDDLDGPSETVKTPESITPESMTECFICLENLHEKPCKALQCEHEFHTDCLEKWKESELENNHRYVSYTCPCCRKVYKRSLWERRA